MRITSIISLLTTLILTTGCGVKSPAPSPTLLVGGTPDSQNQWPSVMIFGPNEENIYRSFCTATKVAPDLILTAAHCVLIQDPEPGETYIGPWSHTGDFDQNNTLTFSFSKSLAESPIISSVPIAALHLPPQVEACIKSPKNRTLCRNRTPLPDIALIRVIPNSEFNKAPTAPIDLEPALPNTAVYMMGYGSEESTYQGFPRLKFAKKKLSTKTEMINALEGTFAKLDGFPVWEYFYGVASTSHINHANLGFGDSGGPLYRASTRSIIGVASDGFCPIPNRQCSKATNSTFSRLNQSKEWLINTLKPL